jgi:hypothetical protein
MQPLLLLKQTVESSFDPGSLRLDGGNIKFSEADQVLTHGKNQKVDAVREFRVALRFRNAPFEEVGLSFSPQAKRLVTAAMDLTIHGKKFELRANAPSHTIAEVVAGTMAALEPRARRKNPPSRAKWEVQRYRCFLLPSLASRHHYSDFYRATYPFQYAADILTRAVTSMIHLPGLRGNPTRSYQYAAVQQFDGTFDQYVASVIASWQTAKSVNPRLRRVNADLRRLELTWKVQARVVNATQLELRVGRTKMPAQGGASDLVNIADVGFGLSQSLPVIVALEAARPSELVYIEQPEIHLHPRAQHLLAGTLVSAAKRGVRVVAETHSSLLLTGIQTAVAEGAIAPDDVALHWLSRNTKGFTELATAAVEKDGSLGQWPADFDDVIIGAESGYVEAASDVALSEE